MKPLKLRIGHLEKTKLQVDKEAPTSAAEQRDREDAYLARRGMTRQEMIAKYGGFPKFGYMEMLGVDHLNNPLPQPREPEPDDGLTAKERYMRMIGR